MAELRAAEFSVTGVERKEKRRRPVPPFITSKLQQEAYRKLRFPVSKTMSVAQRLYEGVEVGDEGLVGLITYMRTDSTRVAQSALQEAREFIQVAFGDAYLPAKAVVYQGRKEAQDAHEAIRPTSALRTPEQVKPFLGRDELRLYELIWKRFLASQMNPALFDQSEIEIQAGRTEFKAVGSVLKFDGFLKLYQEGSDDVAPENGEAVLPEVKVGETLHVEELIPEQKFTQPPPRYTESTLVKALEERGIGRPSTYAQILSVIMLREYVLKQEGRFVPTEIGEIVVGLLVDHFREIFDYDYTARMEQNLDEIERGRLGWLAALQQFYAEFSKELQQARVGMKDLRKEEASAGVACSKCGAPMVIRLGRFGKFMACSNFPDCRNTREIPQEGAAAEVESVGSVASDETCAKCGRPMVLRKGRFGEFLSCSGYPECRTTQRTRNAPEPATGAAGPELDQACPKCGGALAVRRGRYGDFTACTRYPDCRYVKQETTGVVCPTCGKGELLQRKSKRGKVFYGCSAYPACRFVLWRRPVNETCPSCSGAYLVERSTKQGAAMLQCPDPKCGYRTKPAE
jgi:DNA topoisomerase-1